MKNHGRKNTFHFEEYPSTRNAQGVGKFMQGVLLLMNFLKNRPQSKCMIIDFCDLQNTIAKNLIEVGEN